MVQNNGGRQVPKKWILRGLNYRWNVKVDTQIVHCIYAQEYILLGKKNIIQKTWVIVFPDLGR